MSTFIPTSLVRLCTLLLLCGLPFQPSLFAQVSSRVLGAEAPTLSSQQATPWSLQGLQISPSQSVASTVPQKRATLPAPLPTEVAALDLIDCFENRNGSVACSNPAANEAAAAAWDAANIAYYESCAMGSAGAPPYEPPTQCSNFNACGTSGNGNNFTTYIAPPNTATSGQICFENPDLNFIGLNTGRGMVWTMTRDQTISSVGILLVQSAGGVVFEIAEVSNPFAGTVSPTTILRSGTVNMASSSDCPWVDFEFAPLLLENGKSYHLNVTYTGSINFVTVYLHNNRWTQDKFTNIDGTFGYSTLNTAIFDFRFSGETGTGNGSGEVTVSSDYNYDNIGSSCGETGSLTVNYFIEDEAGGFETRTHTFTVTDNTPPTAPAPPADLNLQCAAEVPAPNTLTANDNCEGDITVSPSAVITPGACDNAYTEVRTWTFVDGCGNSSSVSQTINVSDTTPPDAPTPPADLNLQCAAEVPAPNTLTANDNCEGDITVSPSAVITPGACDNAYTEVRTWTFIDGCGNSSSVSQTINVSDTTPPDTPTPPANLNVQCAAEVPAPSALTANDNCDGDITVSPSAVITPGACDNAYTEVRTWTFIDGCGNSSSVSQTINVNDNTAPEMDYLGLSDGSTIEVECNLMDPNWLPFPTTAALNISDNCSDVTVDRIDTKVSETDCANGELSLWESTWTASDACGNTSSYTIFTQIIDTEAPLWTSFPADEVLSCGTDLPLLEPTADDACSELEITYDDAIIPSNCAGTYTVVRTWVATDGCGNANPRVQTFTIVDEAAPVLRLADGYVQDYEPFQDVYVTCEDYGTVTFLQAAVEAYDECEGELDVEFWYDEPRTVWGCGDDVTPNVITYWRAADDCGNETTIYLRWFLIDDEAPILDDVPADACVTELPPVPNVEAVDGCGFATVSFTQSTPTGCDGGQYVIRTWTATDYCGNSSSASQRLTLVSENGPAIRLNYPGLEDAASGDVVRLGAECEDEFPDLGDYILVAEGCADATFAYTQELIAEGSCAEEGFLQAYALDIRAVDLCNNTSTFTLTIELVDETGPSFIDVPAAITIGCSQAIPVPDVSDACSGVARVRGRNIDPLVVSCSADETSFRREWTAIDNCGNERTFVQEVTIIDEEGPVFSGLPEDGCNTITPVPVVSAYDACQDEEVAVSFIETREEGPCGEYILRRWTASDACGNTSEAVRYIYFNDNTAPTLTLSNPSFATYGDGDEVIIETSNPNYDPLEYLDVDKNDVDVVDDCAFEVKVVLERSIEVADDCKVKGYVARHTYTWTATDPCGNSNSLTLTITFVDNDAPIIFQVPADELVYCDAAVPAPGSIIAVDEYSDVEISVSDARLLAPFGERVIRTWTVMDACGNTSTASQFIDIYANTLSCSIIPPTTLNCNTDGNTITVEVTGGQAPYTYQWEMNDYDGYITAGADEATMTFTLGYTTEDFRVTIKDANGCSTTCDVRLSCEPFIVPLIGTTPEDTKGTHKLYPNPATDAIFLHLVNPEEAPATLSLIDVYGKVVWEKRYEEGPTGDVRIALDRYPAGVYFAKVRLAGQQAFMQQFLILE